MPSYVVNELNPRGVFSFHTTALVDLSQLAEVIDSSLRLLENGPRCWFHSPAFTKEAIDERINTFLKSEIIIISYVMLWGVNFKNDLTVRHLFLGNGSGK